VVVFTPPDLSEVLALGDVSWINLQPEVDETGAEELAATGSGYFGVFGARGPVVPFSTWHRRDRSAGIQHATGPKVARRVDVPQGWRVAQDHPKRGLVVRPPDDVTDEQVLTWLVATASRLCPLPLLGRWVAEVHR
jgi:hypothetical protein